MEHTPHQELAPQSSSSTKRLVVGVGLPILGIALASAGRLAVDLLDEADAAVAGWRDRARAAEQALADTRGAEAASDPEPEPAPAEPTADAGESPVA